MPKGAVKGGHNQQGEDLYICRLLKILFSTWFEVLFLAIIPFTNLNLRATMDGARLIGKINPKHHVCYLPHDGKEVIQ